VVKRIDRLTDEQRAAFPVHVERWTKIGLCTDPADRPRAEAGIAGCYRAAGMKPPQIVWVPSPLVACIAGPIAEYVLAKLKNELQDMSVGSGVRSGVVDPVNKIVEVFTFWPVTSDVVSSLRSSDGWDVGSFISSSVHLAIDEIAYQDEEAAVTGAVSSAVHVPVGSVVDSFVAGPVRTEVNMHSLLGVGLGINRLVGTATLEGVRSVLNATADAADALAVDRGEQLLLRTYIEPVVNSTIDRLTSQSVAEDVEWSVKWSGMWTAHSTIAHDVAEGVQEVVREGVALVSSVSADEAILQVTGEDFDPFLYRVVGSYPRWIVADEASWPVRSVVDQGVGRGVRQALDSFVEEPVDVASNQDLIELISSALKTPVDAALDSTVATGVDSCVTGATAVVFSDVHGAGGRTLGEAVNRTVNSLISSGEDLVDGSSDDSAVHSLVTEGLRVAVESVVSQAVVLQVICEVYVPLYEGPPEVVAEDVAVAVRGQLLAAQRQAINSVVISAAGLNIDRSVSVATTMDGLVAIERAVGSAVSSVITALDYAAPDPTVGPCVGLTINSALAGVIDTAIISPVSLSELGLVDSAVRVNLSTDVSLAVGMRVRASVDSAVRDFFDQTKVSDVRSTVQQTYWRYMGAQFWCSWAAYYSYFTDVCDLDLGEAAEVARAHRDTVESCCWWWPGRNVCFVSERPTRIVLEPSPTRSNRLHCEDGPSMVWEGWSLWHLHGVKVDEQIVLRPETQTLDQIRREDNAEVKRLRIERFGWDRYLTEIDAVVVDTNKDEVSETEEALFRTQDNEVILVCACPSTGRVYWLEVPNAVTTCAEAQDWLSGGLSGRTIVAA
jgi:hypothetical protein